MGNRLFGLDIAKIIYKSLGKELLDAVLTVVTEGTRDDSDLTAGTQPTETTHDCKGIVESYEDKYIDGTIIMESDRKILILGDSIKPAAVPKAGDTITIESTTYEIQGIPKRDPAKAHYVCQGR